MYESLGRAERTAPSAPPGRRLNHKVAVVTGGGSTKDRSLRGVGMGTAICHRLAEEGASIAVVDRDLGAAERTVSSINEMGGAAVSCQADVANEADCRAAVEMILGTFGRVNILVNNVGIAGNLAAVIECSEQDWDSVMDINVKSMLFMSKHCIPHLSNGDAIVNISSTSATRPGVAAAYSASKGAVISLTMATAVYCGSRGIRANTVCPGAAWTPMAANALAGPDASSQELERLREERKHVSLLQMEGTAWDIANAVLFLVSDEARWITGQTLTVDGGEGLGRGTEPYAQRSGLA